jgi:hypothetical protein
MTPSTRGRNLLRADDAPGIEERQQACILVSMAANFFRTANGRWRALRFSGCVFLFSSAANLMMHGFHSVPWLAWLLIAAGAFMTSQSEADTPPVKSKGLILAYGIGLASFAAGAVLMLVDLGKHH